MNFKNIKLTVIRIDSSYTAKNSLDKLLLDKLLLEKLLPLNGLLLESENEAWDHILHATLHAHTECKTKCSPKTVEERRSTPDKDSKPYIAGLIYMHIMKLKILTHKPDLIQLA